MSLRVFQIEFDRAGATYTPGEIVSGNVIIDTSKEKSVRGLNVTAKGEAEVHWTEKKTGRAADRQNRGQYQTYNNSEKYFDLKYALLCGQADAPIKIPAGHQEYPFSFQLPCNIPSSFEHQYGHIRYTVKAVIDRPWKFDHECKAAFSVVSSLDLNPLQHRCGAIHDELLENFYGFLCCFNAGSIKVRIRVPSAGYVPGQSIDTTVSFHNSSSSVQVTHLCTKLERFVMFHARTTVKKINSEVNGNKDVGPFSSHGEIVSRLQIPPIPPSFLEYCNIINLEYKLKVCIHVSGVHCKITKLYPILIGTIPLHRTLDGSSFTSVEQTNIRPSSPLASQILNDHVPLPMPMPMPMSTPLPAGAYPRNLLPTGGSTSQAQTTQPIGFVVTRPDEWQTPPPSYEECMSRTEHIMDQNESNHVYGANEPFAPRYPVFNVPAPRKIV